MHVSPPQRQLCPRCQYPMLSGARICPNCGHVVAATSYSPASSDRASLAAPNALPRASAPVTQSSLSSYMGSHHESVATTTPPPAAVPGTPPKKPVSGQQTSKNPFSTMSVIVILVLLSSIGLLLYLLNQSHPAATPSPTAAVPQPALTALSDYHVGATVAGAAGTILHIEGQQFAPTSAITLLLDNAPAPGAPAVQSDSLGNMALDVVITADWSPGTHAISARDAKGHMTKNTTPVLIVPPGEAMTPGPNHSPYDSQTFTLIATVSPVDAVTGAALPAYHVALTITGRPDPAGGAVCDPTHDSGQPVTQTGTTNNVKFTITSIYMCSGGYKGGMLTYTEKTTSYQIVYASGVTCQANVPFTTQVLSGSFITATTASGTYSADAILYQCSDAQTFQSNPQNGTWTGTVSG